MNNNQSKKQRAIQHNKERLERLALEKDKRDNPKKYELPRNEGAERRAREWQAITILGGVQKLSGLKESK